MRHLGWLHAIPEGDKKSRFAKYTASDPEHPLLRMPDIETEHAAGYLLGLLQEAGLMSSGGMGPVPISWVEIDAWLRVTERELSMWERTTIKRLSEEYVSELVQATKADRPAPYIHEEDLDNIDRERVQTKILSVLSKFIRKTPTEPAEEALVEKDTDQ